MNKKKKKKKNKSNRYIHGSSCLSCFCRKKCVKENEKKKKKKNKARHKQHRENIEPSAC